MSKGRVKENNYDYLKFNKKLIFNEKCPKTMIEKKTDS